VAQRSDRVRVETRRVHRRTPAGVSALTGSTLMAPARPSHLRRAALRRRLYLESIRACPKGNNRRASQPSIPLLQGRRIADCGLVKANCRSHLVSVIDDG
jgi:hypothetical protein